MMAKLLYECYVIFSVPAINISSEQDPRSLHIIFKQNNYFNPASCHSSNTNHTLMEGTDSVVDAESGIRNRFFPDLGSRIPTPYFWEFSDNFLGKKFYNSLKIGPNFFLQHFKTKKKFQFCEICGYIKRYDNKFFFTPLFCCCFWIRDSRSGIWVKIRIREKHPGSATLGAE